MFAKQITTIKEGTKLQRLRNKIAYRGNKNLGYGTYKDYMRGKIVHGTNIDYKENTKKLSSNHDYIENKSL
jgi:hypothetical protein